MNLQSLRARAAVHMQRRELGQAGDLYNRIIRSKPGDVEALLALAAISGMSHDFAAAEKFCQRALRINPRLPGAWLNLGSAQAALWNHAGAAESYRKVVELQPDSVLAYQCLGNTLRKLDAHMEAVRVFQQGLVLQPHNSGIYYDLGNTYKACGDIGKAVECFRNAMQFDPGNLLAHANLIACMLYDGATDQHELFRQQLAWGAKVERDRPGQVHYSNSPVSGRRLRVGYCSPDFRAHSVASFFEPLLEAHDTERFETICYSQTDCPDDVTQRLRSLACHWRDTAGMSDDALYNAIRSDKVDILVDLAGLTSGNRLQVFARRPAPVQVNYLGYASSTGLHSIQYRFTDAWADPPGVGDKLHTEQLVRLPHGFLCYRPPADAPALAPLPALEKGYVTFGSFNNIAKVTPEVVRLWADLLRAVPSSRFVCKAQRLSDSSIRRRFREMFEVHGIQADRVDLLGEVESVAGHLGMYERIDVGLDTFPYNGTTTTCEALWMGVPVLVLQGDRHLSRVGISILQQAGLPELIAHDRDACIATAISLAGDTAQLAKLRSGLRNHLMQSLLCDSGAFARDVEAAYLDMWTHWVMQAAQA